jgi:hypothetical protein
LLGAPSVPRETQTPESSISLIGANPSIRIADAGQWETLTPAFEKWLIWKWEPQMKSLLKLYFVFLSVYHKVDSAW